VGNNVIEFRGILIPALPSDFSDSDNGNDNVATRLLNVPDGRWLPVDIIIEVELVHRRFPGPWRADKIAGGYVVRDSNDQALAYIYSRERDADARQFNELTSDEARRVAMVFASLPELLDKMSE
jgi:hypothetical protein